MVMRISDLTCIAWGLCTNILPHIKWIFNFKTKVQKRVWLKYIQKKMHKVGAKKREFGVGIRQVTPAQRKL